VERRELISRRDAHRSAARTGAKTK